MKAICIIGSPRGNGSTAIIVDKVIEGLKENNSSKGERLWVRFRDVVSMERYVKSDAFVLQT